MIIQCTSTTRLICTCTISALGSASINVFICPLISLDIYIDMYIHTDTSTSSYMSHTHIHSGYSSLTCSPTLDNKLLMRNFMSSLAVLIKVMSVCRAFTACASPSTAASLDITVSNWRVSGIFDSSSRTYSMSLRLIQSYRISWIIVNNV